MHDILSYGLLLLGAVAVVGVNIWSVNQRSSMSREERAHDDEMIEDGLRTW